ncbi:unnamed protein product [Camellia sinensis]
MERVRQKKKLKVPITNEGNRQTQRQRSVPKLASDYSSYIGGTTKEDLFTCELGRSSSRQVTGTPIKKLLAEEMSKETESKRRPGSVITRLMGLDGLPPQQPLHRQDKRFSETYQHRTISVVSQRDVKPYERRMNRKNSMEQQEFKDVYEVLETSEVDRGSHPAKGTVNPRYSEAEMAFIRRKLMNVKCLSADEMLDDSKEFCDTFDRLDTNQDLLMQYLQQQDSLFAKHLSDLKGSAPRSHCSHIAVLKPTNSVNYESNTIGWKSEKETSRSDTGSHWKHLSSLSTHSYNHRGAQKPVKSSKIQLEGKHETDILPKRIVVLKPNLEKVRHASKSALSPSSSHCHVLDCRKLLEYSSIGTGETRAWVEKNISSDAAFSRLVSKEPREIAKEITRKMRESFCSEPINLSSIKGYAADESSYNVSGSDSASESEVSMSRKSFHWSNRQKFMSSNLMESSVIKEAKKRLSERWKMSQKYQVVGEVGKGSTLGEMLTIPDREMRPENLDPVIELDEPSDRFAGNDEIAEWDNPLGISSRDGWKDGCVRYSSRLRFVPASCVGPKTSKQRQALDQYIYSMPREAMNSGRNKAIKGNLNKKEDSLSRNLRSDNKKWQSPCCTYGDISDSLEEKHFNQFQMGINLGKKDPSGQKSLASANNVNTTSSITDVEVDAEHEDMTMSSESPDELASKLSPCLLGNGNSSTPGPEDSKAQEPQIEPSKEDPVPLQCPVPEPPSPGSSKDADHPSPVSVLEIPFTEEISSGSECFERVSADLQGLRMQLKLLKMESGAYTDEGMLMSSDKDDEIFEDDSFECSYLIDVLIDSGFEDADPDMIIATWHSPDCPLGPGVFDNLEKKYCNETWLRSERRLLFDLINSGLVEIFQWLINPHPWVKLLTRKVGPPEWQKHGLKYEVRDFLENEEKKARDEVTERLLDREMLWLDSGDGIDAIGKEIEKLLIDDLIAEVADM